MKQTNLELIRLMAANNLKQKDVAKILKVSLSTVKGWTCSDTSTRHRNLDQIKLSYLKTRIKSNNLRRSNREAQNV